MLDSELGFYNYNIFRCDKSCLTSNCNRGGGVLIGIRKICVSELSGPDRLPPIILSKCCYALAHPVHTLFNLSLALGIVPRLWKSSFVIPIFKASNRNLVRNYRRIYKLSS